MENAAALVPFFELLYRHQKGEIPGPVRILHYGDSHTAADEWTGELRARFQEKFGDGGSGYSFAGRPWNGYRREDVRTGSTSGWHTDGLVGRAGDGIYGLGGVSMTTRAPHEAVYLARRRPAVRAVLSAAARRRRAPDLRQRQSDGADFNRWRGAARLLSSRSHARPAQAGAETLDHAPVRLFGWVAENATGVTYETLGINGAQASIILDWNEPLRSRTSSAAIRRLIVWLTGPTKPAAGTGRSNRYRDMFKGLIARIREAAPAATILVIGPPDRDLRTRKGWQAMDQIDMIIEAQREAAVANGCAFWDMRAKMGGKGSMQQWVTAGMAQYDHVHFTVPGIQDAGRRGVSRSDGPVRSVPEGARGCDCPGAYGRRCTRSAGARQGRNSEGCDQVAACRIREAMAEDPTTEFYCPRCAQPAPDPLVCGDCASIICRRCGTPLERVDELGIG